jgi:hypothetical protein
MRAMRFSKGMVAVAGLLACVVSLTPQERGKGRNWTDDDDHHARSTKSVINDGTEEQQVNHRTWQYLIRGSTSEPRYAFMRRESNMTRLTLFGSERQVAHNPLDQLIKTRRHG